MINNLRQAINAQYSDTLYEQLLLSLAEKLGEAVDFRVAESPVFVGAELRDQLVEACELIGQAIMDPAYLEQSKKGIPAHQWVPGDDSRPTLLITDFAICMDDSGKLYPQVIELQGFPSLFCYQSILAQTYRQLYQIPQNYGPYLSGYTHDTYVELLNRLIKGNVPTENVVLLELEPHLQKTRVDFMATEQLTGVKSVCLSKVIREDRKLFYMRDGVKTPIYRIYNRVIFDELEQRPDLIGDFDLTQEVDVEWVSHPNWYFRMSKYSLPFLKNRYVPESQFVSELQEIPADLENWVLKPLYSFAGSGVQVDVTPEAIATVDQPEHYLLQRKVEYAPVLESPEGGVKIEIRMMVMWPEGSNKPEVVTNLARLSRGKLIGVRFNKDFNWVGGSSAFFEH
ncbi:MAG: hypothetical protein C0424_07965 [Sphingobacteriaceae bacterium]|nr:hypothetical protein [Sphingobacteriaceae bacterium]